MALKRIALLLAALALFSGTLRAQGGRQLWNDGWKFRLTEEDASAPDYDDRKWRSLDLPHDWGVEGGFRQEYPGETGKLAWWGKAWYRKHLSVTEEDLRGLVLLDVDGAMSNATVWVNGRCVGGWPYGYASWEVDMTEALHVGDNVVAIHLDNKEDSSRWYPGGGIYRNLWLVKDNRVGVAYSGIGVTTELAGNKARVTVTMALRNRSGSPGKIDFTMVVAPEDQPFAGEVDPETMAADFFRVDRILDGDKITHTLEVPNPRLWSPEQTHRYTLDIAMKPESGEGLVSTVSFGIRTAEWKPDGFYLNGKKTFLRGVCLHHDAGGLGAAWNTSAWIRRLTMLKEMGCNAIRTSHNPPAPELLYLCDAMGFLVVDELTDTWTYAKKPNGYAALFDEWAEKDLVAMIRRDRNHPSVILWSIGNECGEQGDPERWWIPEKLTSIAHREDPTRPTTAGNDNLWAASTDYASTIDVYGFNYKPHAYEAFRDAHPGQPFFGSETASCISTRGYYLFPVAQDKGSGWIDGGAPFQVSSYDLYAPGWASKPDYEWLYEDQVPECAGEFVWTGFDYLGEPTPYNLDLSVLSNFHTEEEKEAYRRMVESWGSSIASVPLPSRSSYFGIFDLAGFPKDRYWLYQSRWRPELPMAHILPHWNWPGREGEITPVHVYTSGDSGELFINGRSNGMRKKAPGQYRLVWDDVVYEPGKVEVVCFKDGNLWATDEVETTGAPAHLGIQMETGSGPSEAFGGDADSSSLLNEKYIQSKEILIFDIRITDAENRIVPTADNLVKVKLKGPAELLYLDAGDPTAHTPFQGKQFRVMGGLGTVAIRITGNGTVTLKVRSKGLNGLNYVMKYKDGSMSSFVKLPWFSW